MPERVVVLKPINHLAWFLWGIPTGGIAWIFWGIKVFNRRMQR